MDAAVTRSDIEEHLEALRASAELTQIQLAELAGTEGPLEFLYQLKFNAIGCDPLRPAHPHQSQASLFALHEPQVGLTP